MNTKTKNAVAVKEKKGSEIAQTDLAGNFFEAYGQQVSQKSIVGDLLKFNKGDWLAGQEDEEIEEGTRLVANMDQLLVGWIKWVDNKPDQQLMGPISEGFQPAKRSELGDDDEAEWEVGTDGKARDPWQFSNYLVLKEAGGDRLFTFATSSKGGIGAIGALCREYGKEMRTHADQYPIVELGSSKYKHSNPEFGWIKTPLLNWTGEWEDKSSFEMPDEEEEDKKSKAKTKAKGRK